VGAWKTSGAASNHTPTNELAQGVQAVRRVSVPKGLGTVDEFRYLKTQTDKPVKATVPGPVTLSIHIQTRPGDGVYNNDRLAICWDMVPAVNAELKALEWRLVGTSKVEARDTLALARRRAVLHARFGEDISRVRGRVGAAAEEIARWRGEGGGGRRGRGGGREDDRAVLMYRYFLDLSEAEMAQALGCRRGTVKSRLHRAHRALAAELGECHSAVAPAWVGGAVIGRPRIALAERLLDERLRSASRDEYRRMVETNDPALNRGPVKVPRAVVEQLREAVAAEVRERRTPQAQPAEKRRWPWQRRS